MIKVSLCIYHNKIPPHSAATSLNDALQLDVMCARFPNDVIHQENIIASVSSFGMSGSNAHVLLGSDKPRALCHMSFERNAPYVLCLSAKSHLIF